MHSKSLKIESFFSERLLYRNFIYKKVNENNLLQSSNFLEQLIRSKSTNFL